jgi:hypothetical protein
MIWSSVLRLTALAIVTTCVLSEPCAAQAPPPAAAPADQPSIKVGVLIFADYTIQQQPKIKDADGNSVTLSAFQITRSYINVTGNISRTIAFRVTPDITRETGVGSALNGSYTFRLKFAFAQWNLDDHLTKGSYARFGLQPTPWLEFIDGIYRYRFQSPTFVDREAFLPTSDAGAALHYALPRDYGDVVAGVYNGEGYTRPEVNDQKSVEMRGTLRPLPRRGALHGLRVTGFWDHDASVKNADRRRAIGSVTFEHPHVHAGFDYLDATDQTSAASAAVESRGWSAFVTPITGKGWEGLVRFDHLEAKTPTSITTPTKERAIGGVAYWFPHQGSVSAALMFDVDNTTFDGFSSAQGTQRKFAVHALVSY